MGVRVPHAEGAVSRGREQGVVAEHGQIPDIAEVTRCAVARVGICQHIHGIGPEDVLGACGHGFAIVPVIVSEDDGLARVRGDTGCVFRSGSGSDRSVPPPVKDA